MLSIFVNLNLPVTVKYSYSNTETIIVGLKCNII